ncbi:hypothetical protein BH11BAC2_BH11BAC2_15390 [soil metagenome]
MKKLKILGISFSLICILQTSGMAQKSIEGEFYFQRMEMVAGFNFTADGKFQFFYSYGAVDRNASGSYSIEGDLIKLKSDKEPGKDFTITQQSKKGHGYTLVFEDPNKYFLSNIRCLFYTDGKPEEVLSNSDGEVHVEFAHCDSIYIQHGLYPDIFTLIKDEKNQNNFFRISLNRTLEQVSFKGIDLKIQDDSTLTCLANYLMPMENISFLQKK